MSYCIVTDKTKVKDVTTISIILDFDEELKWSHHVIPISKSSKFTRFSSFLKGNECTLSEIDAFTTQFYDYEELKKHLIDESLLRYYYHDESYFDLSINKVCLARITPGNCRLYEDGILYQKDLKYILNPEELILEIKNRLNNGEYDFIIALAKQKFNKNVSECDKLSTTILNAAKKSQVSGKKSVEFSVLDDSGNDIITNLIKLLIYKHRVSQNGRVHFNTNQIVGEGYERLHTIISLMNKYDSKKKVNDQIKGTARTKTLSNNDLKI